MRSIPGKVEISTDFIDSAVLTQETEWMDSSFMSPQRRSSYLGPRMSFSKGRDRPNSAPRERVARDFMSSTPNLSLSSVSDPGPLNPNPELFASYSPGEGGREGREGGTRGRDRREGGRDRREGGRDRRDGREGGTGGREGPEGGREGRRGKELGELRDGG